MRNLLLIISFIIFSGNIPAKELPRYTQTCTAAEMKNSQWNSKITTTDTLTHYIVQLVTSKEKDNYSTTWVCMQIFERTTGKCIQEIDLSEYEYHAGPEKDWMENGDFNFDGYEDFSLFEASYAMGNTTSRYFLFNPKKKTFFDGNFEDTDLSFDSQSKTITSFNRCCAGKNTSSNIYKLVNNKMTLIEQNCEELDENTGEYVEVDCKTPYMDIQFKSVGLKKNFHMRMALYDEDLSTGFVVYNKQPKRISIRFNHTEIIESHQDEGRPNERKLVYDEMYNDAVTGSYSITIQGAIVYGASYTRKTDGKVFSMDVVDFNVKEKE